MTERVKLLETESLALFVTVPVMVTTVPAGTQNGASQMTWLVVPVFEAAPGAPMLAVHEKLSRGVSSSWAVTLKVTEP
jgi:hypothetical protein